MSAHKFTTLYRRRVHSQGFTRVSSGLLASENFSNLSAWINDTNTWTVEEIPVYVAYPTERIFLPLGISGSSDYGTIRELGCYYDNGTLLLFYDASNAPNFLATTTMGVHLASSTDGGKTWIRRGRQLNPSGGYWARMNGFVFKEGSTYYLYCLNNNPTGNGEGPPYTGSIFTSSSITGAWSLVSDFPGVGTSGQWDSVAHYPMSLVYYSGTYYAIIGGATPTATQIGYDTASNPDGTFTKAGTFGLSGVGMPENPKVWWDSVLNKWCMIANQINSSGLYTDSNRLFVSDNLTDWSAATFKDIQYNKYGSDACAIDTTQGDVIGVGSPIYTLSKTVYRDGIYIPFTYDALPTDGNHQGRKGMAGALEPSRYCAQGISSGGVGKNLRLSISHNDFVAEFSLEIVVGGVAEYYYRRDNSGAEPTNGYDLSMSNSGPTILYKFSGGSPTSIATHGTSLTVGRNHRFRIEVSGNNHKIYIDGVKVIDVNDSTYTSGATMAFRAYNVTMRVRNFHVRKSNIVTINNAPANVELQTPGGIYVTEHQTSITHTHYPMRSLRIGSSKSDFSDGIYGGDVYDYS